ncbi:MAG TPA: molybdopterin cofactor-binding domain-containing protein, partial [Cyclobacteriaceae bacterium]|nr:molybdopterin cofactor-binding domain-containing protein [Cyclobacteriaceae bacterium]
MIFEDTELQPSPLHSFNIDRRKFFKILGSGVAVAFILNDSVAGGILSDSNIADESPLSAWIHIGENNVITIFTGKVEVGQNIRTSLAQAVAEELRVNVNTIQMVMGDTDLTPYDRGTFGSLTTPTMAPQLRKAAASARELLRELAATEWGVDKSSLKVENGGILNPKNKQLKTFGEISKGKKLIKNIDESAVLTPSEKWTIAGTSIPKVNGDHFVTGRHKYVSDMQLPGMLYGKVLRAPSFEAGVISVDLSAAKSMAGVTVVHDGNFIGVAAPDGKTAEKAISQIKADWKITPQPSRDEIFDYLVKNSEDRNAVESKGNIKDAYDEASVKSEQTFYVDYIAHAPLEPRSALAEWKDGKVTVWTGTQRPFGVQEELTNAFHISKDKVRVIVPDTGSGYGGKHSGDAALEAARLAKAAQKPVKVVWTREEEFTWAYFRPAGVITVKAGANSNGMLTSWEFHNYNSGGSGIETPYEVPNQEIKYHPVKSPLRQGSYRGLAATANTFARECIMNDLADDLKIDQLEFRLKNLKDERLRDVLVAAADKFGWRKTNPGQHHGYGIACGEEKGSVIATCAEVMHDPSGGDVKVLRVVAAFECGAVINPRH